MGRSLRHRRFEARRDWRSGLSLPAGLYGRGVERAVVRMVDLSPAGCRVLGARPGAAGGFFTLEIAGVLSVEARVAWTRGGELGLDFVHPMPLPLIDHLLTLGAGEG